MQIPFQRLSQGFAVLLLFPSMSSQAEISLQYFRQPSNTRGLYALVKIGASGLQKLLHGLSINHVKAGELHEPESQFLTKVMQKWARDIAIHQPEFG